jgi:hypothetical protein
MTSCEALKAMREKIHIHNPKKKVIARRAASQKTSCPFGS